LKRISALLLVSFSLIGSAVAQESSVIATVNDHPVTSFDVDQRIRLLRILGQTAAPNRKKLANDLINDVVKIDEAKRSKIEATDKEVDERLNLVAKSLKTDRVGLEAKLKAQGVTVEAFKQYTASQMDFGRLLSAKYKEKIEADPSAVDKKLAALTNEINGKVAKAMADPRMQPINVYSLLEINFPVEGGDPQLMQSRAIEAGQYAQKFKSCSNPRGPAAGIFNVQVGKKLEADSRKLPQKLKSLFDSKGPGHAYGPMRTPKGVQVLAFCAKRVITPPKPNVKLPTRQQIENVVLNEKYDAVEQKYVALMRKNAVIEYKDPTYAE
jgi:peptidyl-prolyl cis-trans isomerase SurA